MALGVSVISCDALGEIEPRFCDEEKTCFVGLHDGPFCQIKARRSQSPVLDLQTHFRTRSTFADWKIAVESTKPI
ncbi:MAG: hypothetical protein J2P55_14465, partial [Rhizobiales bacterium]|nr:hypothetical protein [Hyphomicrobiales bacterium]